MKRIFTILAIFLLGFGASQLLSFLQVPYVPRMDAPVGTTREATTTPRLTPGDPTSEVLVVRVIDGDTIELEGGQRVRYIGIDTPETVDPRNPVECFGREAASENRRLVEGKLVSLAKDVSETDRFGRLLRYVYIDEVMVNETLVRNGFAYAVTYPPDVKYQEQLQKAEQEAKENNQGLWSGCLGALPAMQQLNNETILPGVKEVPGSPCQIKGNISTTRERIYHISGCGSYDKTSIDESRGERWFCTEEEARGAGWRKAKNCP